MATTAVVWFRRDLRLHDNETLVRAADADELLPVFVLDPREYGEQPYGGPDSFTYRKADGRRLRFRLDALADLRERLRDHGSDLLVAAGRPEEALARLAEAVDADRLHFQKLPGPEERTAATDVVETAREAGCSVHRHWTHTLHHIADLPTSYRSIQDTFTPFKDAVEANAPVREPFDVPSLPSVPAEAPARDPIPDVETAGEAVGADLRPPESDDRAVLPFEGGESRALERLETYVWERDRLRTYRETRNGLLGAEYSSKLSPWLNQGALSPRRVHEVVKRYEDDRVANDSTYWLLFELRWRDFFQFQVAKHGERYFRRPGIREREDIDWFGDDAQFRRWAAGETGIPFVDANMRELNRTGYMSNRGRQNVASFLANNLRVDWRRGAAYFERRLVDYDPCSNYGNWAYVAGVGNDSRDRYFNVVKQAKKYDGDAEYVGTWLPALDPLPPEYAHQPWAMSEGEQLHYGVELGVDYPEPMVDLDASYDHLRG
ncbi:MAG: DASH family cryptochrome [Halolamina sp.]